MRRPRWKNLALLLPQRHLGLCGRCHFRSFSKIENLDEFRVPILHQEGPLSNPLPQPANKCSYELTWPFSMKAFSAIDSFQVPSPDTTILEPDLQLNETAGDSLREAISSGLVRSKFDRKEFLPEKTFGLLFNRSSIRACLPTATKSLVDFINENGRRVFATVLSCTDLDGAELVSLLESFHRQQFCDSHLPIARQCPPECENQKRAHLHTLPYSKLSVFRHPFWRAYMIKRFYHGQWAFLSPTFSKNAVTDKLYPDSILPFTSLGDVVQEGTFSTVYQATMPVEHQDVMLNVESGELKVAIKELKNVVDNHGHSSITDVESAWRREGNALRRMNTLGQSNLMPLIASFERDHQYYFIFPWADGGNLRNFWKSNPHINLHLSGHLILEYLEQLEGLADGLRKFHDLAARHGDLKPENILLRKDHGWLGTLQIADFGLVKKHQIQTELRRTGTDEIFGTMVYEPPEVAVHSERPTSRLYDIWSMGCIIFESLIWLLYGLEGLDSFYNAGPQHHWVSYRRPAAETPYYSVDREGTVSLTEEVLHWYKETFAQDPECNNPDGTALGDLLDLVKTKLLVIACPDRRLPYSLSTLLVEQKGTAASSAPSWEPCIPVIQLEVPTPTATTPEAPVPTRADAKTLCRELQRIVSRAKADPIYLFSGQDRSGLAHYRARTDPVPSSLSRKRRHYNKPSFNIQPVRVWHFAQIAWLIIGLQRLRLKLVAMRNRSEGKRITKSATKVGSFWNRLPTSTSEVEGDFATTDLDSSQVPETLASSPSSKVPISDPVSDRVISSLFTNKSPSEIVSMLSYKSPLEIAAMFSSTNPRVPETSAKPEKQSTHDESDEVASKVPRTHPRQNFFNNRTSNTSRKRRPAFQTLSRHSH